MQQPPFAATQVQNATRATGFQRGEHRAKTLFVEADGALNGLLFQRMNLGGGIGIRGAFICELNKRVVHQAALMLKITAGNGLAFGM